MIDGGPGAEPEGCLDAWLVTDDRGELIRSIRLAARARDVEPEVAAFRAEGLVIGPRPVVHTSHPAYGYVVELGRRRVVWAPEFLDFPDWAEGADLMFSEAAAWDRPIRFRGGVGGHAPVLEIAREARARGVRRLVFCHIGRPGTSGRRRRGVRAGPAPEAEEGGSSRERAGLPAGVGTQNLPIYRRYGCRSEWRSPCVISTGR